MTDPREILEQKLLQKIEEIDKISGNDFGFLEFSAIHKEEKVEESTEKVEEMTKKEFQAQPDYVKAVTIMTRFFDPERQDETGKDKVELILEEGDLCIYKGTEMYHWRKPFIQSWYLQTFIHYVNSEGPYKDNIFDGRRCLGIKK
jgi:hypothetical protein